MRNVFTLILFSEQPDNYDSNEICLASLTLSGKAGQLNDVPCNCNLTGYISQSGRFYTSYRFYSTGQVFILKFYQQEYNDSSATRKFHTKNHHLK